MMFKYLGVIDELDFHTWSLDERNQYLQKNELFTVSYSSNAELEPDKNELGLLLMRIEFSEKNKKLVPTKDLRQDFYDYIKHKYRAAVGYAPIMFDKEFNVKTFGIKSKKKVRSLALQEFNFIFEKFCSPTYHKMTDRFKALSLNRVSYVDQLSGERDLIEAYLLGKEDKFNRALYENSDLLIELLEFEGQLKVLLSLNKEYNFAADNFFQEKPIYLKICESLETLNDVNTWKFIEDCINKIEKNLYSEMTALFFFLKSQALIRLTENEFRSIIKTNYNLEFGLLKISDQENRNYRQRLNKYSKKWSDFEESEGK